MTWTGRYSLGLLLSLAGCFSKPGYAGPGDGGGDATDATDATDAAVTVPMLTVTEDTRVRVGTAAFTMTFEATDWLMPESLVLTNEPGERLSFSHPFTEHGLGITLYNRYGVNGGLPIATGAGTGTATRQVVVSGPAKVSVEVRWNGPAHCPGDTALSNNKSAFHFYPDGRIVRHDVVNTEEACDKNLGSVSSLAWTAGMTAVFSLMGTVAMIDHPNPSDQYMVSPQATQGWACLQTAGSAIGMTWLPPASITELEAIELHVLRDGLSVGYFFAEMQDTLPGHLYVASTALVVRADGTRCTDLAAGSLAAFQRPPTLQNAAFQPDDGTYRLAGPGSAEAQATLPAGFVLEYETTASTVTILRESSISGRSRALEVGLDYVSQRDGNTFTWFMVDRLAAGERLVVSEP